MRAHGFTADQLATMVHMGFAAQTAERVVGTFRQTSEIKITEEGERALGYHRVTGSAASLPLACGRAQKRRPASARASVRFPPERRPYTLCGSGLGVYEVAR